ncbi:MAG: chromosome segregation protein SMC [Planctomycetota bacterium]|nr:chromosome segregation protein SMC [Planctomycetota bacterium]
MKIRQLQIQGFKSFADRTVFDFDDGITAIVGPNGCGKSNVVDAIKWVLGDMSPRSLRGKRMEDVIFAGSRGRRPLPMAEVTLIMDNEDGLLPIEHAEVSITRRLDRQGQSDYLLNGTTCRLRDIRELFLDTGIGMEGNSIMEQGQIDALLAANPADRRGIFEEAAGVSRYKQRRKEADQRLKRTGENLERLRDVLDLEEKRLRSLKTQAARARRYQVLREELGQKRVLRAVVRYRGIAEERDGLQARMQEALDREATAAAELSELETRAKDAEREREEARERVHALETRITQALSDARAARDRVEYAARSVQDLEARIEDARRKAEGARSGVGRIESELESLEGEAAEADAASGTHIARLADVESELARLEGEAARIRDAHDGAKREALAALGRIGDARNQEAECRADLRQSEERLARLAEQHAELVARRDRVDAEARDLYVLAASLEAEGKTRADALEATEARQTELVGTVETAHRRRATSGEERATKASRLEVLEGLAASLEGVDDGARRILEAVREVTPDKDGARDGVLGTLADLVSTDPAHAARLDGLLGHAAGAVVMRTHRDAIRWIEWLRAQGQGERARLLSLDMARPEPEIGGTPLGPMECDPRVERLVRSVVSQTVLVPDLIAGVQEYIERGVNAVTPAGDRVTASGAMLGGRDAPSLGLVQRTAERRSLVREVARLDREVEAARTEASEAESALAACREMLRRLREEIAQHGADHSRRREAIERVEKERTYVVQGIETVASERGELESFRADAAAQALSVAARVAELEAERVAVEERAEEAGRGYLAIEAERKTFVEQRMETQVALAELRSRAQGARQRAERARAEVRGLQDRALAYEAEADELAGRIERVQIDATEAEAEARRSEEARTEAGGVLLGAREALEALEASAGTVDGRRREVHEAHEGVRAQLEGLRVRDGEFRSRIEALIEQVRQDQGLELEAVASEIEPTEALDLDGLDAELLDLRAKLEGLGNVNLNAIEELEEVEQHVTFLQTQEKDLLDASVDLEKAIKELDEISTERFSKTFAEIRDNFRDTFRQLFGGGRADVMLEDASNLLESGIEIIARPPGKEQRTISLLSGGERTLTAVALLFAVFKAKPSPFSILDEVDAALDEANVRRLIHLVREFTDRCQFVVITHAKATMETADVLYGVTMKEPGVSDRVAVRLTEFPEEALTA